MQKTIFWVNSIFPQKNDRNGGTREHHEIEYSEQSVG